MGLPARRAGERCIVPVDQMHRCWCGRRVGRSLRKLGALKRLRSDSNRITLIVGASCGEREEESKILCVCVPLRIRTRRKRILIKGDRLVESYWTPVELRLENSEASSAGLRSAHEETPEHWITRLNELSKCIFFVDFAVGLNELGSRERCYCVRSKPKNCKHHAFEQSSVFGRPYDGLVLERISHSRLDRKD